MKKTILLAIGSFMLWACSSHTEQKTSDLETKQTEHQHTEATELIELNSGAKWSVNAEMRPFIIKGEELVEAYIISGQNNHQDLAQQLKEQNDKLIESCTMDGKSHDELHKWLHPHLKMVDALENSSAESDAKEIVLKLQDSYKMYHQYFE